MWVPHELVHTDFTLPLPTGSGCFIKSSNGLASGNHVLEAISHGICEVVERDSLSLWHLHNQETRNQTRLDLDTVDDPDCRDLLAKFEQAKIAVAAWEVTSDIRLPVFMCVIKERTDNPLRPLYASSGSGCHPDRAIALLRALTEAAQSRLTHISGARDDNFRTDYERGRSLDLLRRVQAEIETRGQMLRFPDAPTSSAETLDEDVTKELEQLVNAGIERVIVVDLTKPEFGLPVVRVVVPGLEGTNHSPQYAPGARASAVMRQQA